MDMYASDSDQEDIPGNVTESSQISLIVIAMNCYGCKQFT